MPQFLSDASRTTDHVDDNRKKMIVDLDPETLLRIWMDYSGKQMKYEDGSSVRVKITPLNDNLTPEKTKPKKTKATDVPLQQKSSSLPSVPMPMPPLTTAPPTTSLDQTPLGNSSPRNDMITYHAP